ncbi:copper homeostasis protein CutC [Paraglaciecola sp. Hal342]
MPWLNRAQAIETLIELGVQRILTSGCDWGSHDTAQQHCAQLARYIALAKGQIEIVIGGGIAPASAKLIAQAISQQMEQNYHYSFHAYSSALIDGVVHENPFDSYIKALMTLNSTLTKRCFTQQ